MEGGLPEDREAARRPKLVSPVLHLQVIQYQRTLSDGVCEHFDVKYAMYKRVEEIIMNLTS